MDAATRARTRPGSRRGGDGRVEASGPVGDMLALLARSHDGVFAVDGEQRVVFWSASAEELLGRPAGEVLGRYCYDVLLAGGGDGHASCRPNCPAIRGVRRGRKVPDFDTVARTGGEPLRLNVSTVPVPNGADGGPLAIHMFRSVSKRRRRERLAGATPETAAGGPGPALTPRETDVLRLLAEGLTTEQLCARLTLSRATVRNHIQRLLAKLGVHSRLEAVLRAARDELI